MQCFYRFFFPGIPILVALLFFATGSHPILAAQERLQPRAEARKLQNLYGGLTSLSFNFDQVTRSGGRERRGSGNAVFIKLQEKDGTGGNKNTLTSVMRWNYTEPDTQIIINDGQTLSIYTEKDKQLIKTSSLELESDITYAFFTGTRKLLDDFDAEPAENGLIFSSGQQLQTILLVPKQPHNQIKSVQLWYDGNSIIHHMAIRDHFESVTELNFDNIAVNFITDINRQEIDKITTLQVPSGTEIITQ